MSMEMVRRMRENRLKVIFDGEAIPDPTLNESADIPEPEEKDVENTELVDMEVKDDLHDEEENSGWATCVCGGKNFVEEDGQYVCSDCGRFAVKISDIDDEGGDLPKKEQMNEGRYTGTTTVRRTAEQVLSNHGLSNSCGQYDKFVNRMWNLYKETLLDREDLEKTMEREFKKMYPNMNESNDPLDDKIKNVVSGKEETVGDYLNKQDKDRKKGHRIIRSEPTPICTANRPNIDAAITEAVFGKKK